MPRLTLPFLALLAGGALLVPAVQGQAPPPTGETFTLVQRHSEARVTLIDSAPLKTKRKPSESPGDRVVGRAVIRDAAGKPVGTGHSDFTVTSGRTPRTTEQVHATFALAAGQLATQGVIDQVGDSELLAVIGGTGAYAGARGTVEITGDDTAVTFRVTLLPPG